MSDLWSDQPCQGTGPGHVYRALLEATAFGVRHNLAEFAAVGVEARRVVAVGGGTQGELWTGIVSSAAGVTQEVPSVTVGAVYDRLFPLYRDLHERTANVQHALARS